MGKIKNINQSKVDKQTVNTLKELLAEAESGELQSVMYIDYYRDGTVGSGWAGAPNKTMIGELEDLKFNFFSEVYFQMEID